MCTSRYAYQAPSAMLRARRKDANVRPNRWLDKKSSRGMLYVPRIYENEELRLRTIEINAEVERGQGDIKKLKRQNEQLRRYGLLPHYRFLNIVMDGDVVEGEYYEEQEEEEEEEEQELYEDETQIEEVKEKRE
ncbi:hypothetical protein B566_EDAN002955 [Ephemera danica]|nr:hypothetical protein B566_EDAN002955 [Ephemera danica]